MAIFVLRSRPLTTVSTQGCASDLTLRSVATASVVGATVHHVHVRSDLSLNHSSHGYAPENMDLAALAQALANDWGNVKKFKTNSNKWLVWLVDYYS